MSHSDSFHILYLENANLPTAWAHGRQIMFTCDAFVQAGAGVELVLPLKKNQDRSRGLFEYYGLSPTFHVSWLAILDLIHCVPPRLKPIPYVFARWIFFWQLKRFLRQHSQVKSEVIYTRDQRVVEAISLTTKSPIILELHDDPRQAQKIWNRIKTRVAGFVVISEGLKQLLKEEGIPDASIHIAPDGFDDRVFSNLLEKSAARAELGVPKDQTLVVYAGQLFPWKGVDSLASAFEFVPEGCELVFIGGQPEDIARVRGCCPHLPERVRFIGEQPHERVRVWLAAADAALLPTSAQFAIGKSYTSPLKLFEYLAAGLPIVASDVPTSRAILDEEVACFFEPDQGDSLIAALKRFQIFSEDRRKEMSLKAKTRATAYTWNKRGEGIVDFLRTIITRSVNR